MVKRVDCRDIINPDPCWQKAPKVRMNVDTGLSFASHLEMIANKIVNKAINPMQAIQTVKSNGLNILMPNMLTLEART